MLIKSRKSWEIKESEATSELVFQKRRALVKGIAAGAALGPGLAISPKSLFARETGLRFPAVKNLRYRIDRKVTPEKLATSYNNFYEFGSHKEIASDHSIYAPLLIY